MVAIDEVQVLLHQIVRLGNSCSYFGHEVGAIVRKMARMAARIFFSCNIGGSRDTTVMVEIGKNVDEMHSKP